MKKLALLFITLALFSLNSCSSSSSSNDTQELLDQAYDIVSAQYPDVRLFEAFGIVGETGGTSQADIVRWQFVYCDASVDCAATVILHWENGVFGNPEYVEDAWLEDEFIPLPLNSSIDDAVEIMSDAGYSGTFLNVTLRRPVGPVEAPEAYYIFRDQEDDLWVFVGVDSGEITTYPIE